PAVPAAAPSNFRTSVTRALISPGGGSPKVSVRLTSSTPAGGTNGTARRGAAVGGFAPGPRGSTPAGRPAGGTARCRPTVGTSARLGRRRLDTDRRRTERRCRPGLDRLEPQRLPLAHEAGRRRHDAALGEPALRAERVFSDRGLQHSVVCDGRHHHLGGAL